jgi:hypothetical protein
MVRRSAPYMIIVVRLLHAISLITDIVTTIEAKRLNVVQIKFQVQCKD